ncbi:DUF2240 family protein [Haladaptatus sp. DYSN1]|uniref:DUF2240 family protein n=1 Tax=unclassified Haladaptatus TaxID=2622732 RepID=UPI0024050351|nr:DUF2240 family protein [Haladaptatus sp. DYSN1]
MSLRVAAAAPFRTKGKRKLAESEFVVALSLDRDWFSPDQAKRLVDIAVSQGLLSRDDGTLICEFDPDDVTIPDNFAPDASLLQERSTFEKILDRLIADGHSKQEAVAAVNELQRELGVTIETAAVLFAHRRGVAVDAEAKAALGEL